MNNTNQSKDSEIESVENFEENDAIQEQARVGELNIKDLKVDGVKGPLLEAVRRTIPSQSIYFEISKKPSPNTSRTS
jgi:hypothetical protein